MSIELNFFTSSYNIHYVLPQRSVKPSQPTKKTFFLKDYLSEERETMEEQYKIKDMIQFLPILKSRNIFKNLSSVVTIFLKLEDI